MKKTLFLLFLFSLLSIHRSVTLDEFIRLDKTNEIQFIPDVFDCQQYTDTFIKNSRYYGFDAFPVYAGFNKNGILVHHMFVEVDTPDGRFWVEPQLDLYYKISSTSLCLTDGRCVSTSLTYIFTEKELNQTSSSP